MMIEKYIALIKTLKERNYQAVDWGMDRVFMHLPVGGDYPVFTFTYRDKPNSNANDIIHLMAKSKYWLVQSLFDFCLRRDISVVFLIRIIVKLKKFF